MVEWHLGTMGFSYKDWIGGFYPKEIAAQDYLSYYSRIFDAVEIDSTFYGTPKVENVERWGEVTPDEFVFCLKTPRTVTHEMALVGVEFLMNEFLETVSVLRGKLGVVLIQLPPSFHAQQVEPLDAFLSLLPKNIRFAVEVRHPSWYAEVEVTGEVFSKHGVAWASTQYPLVPSRVNVTAPHVYVRWIGQHGAFARHYDEQVDRSEELQVWAGTIQDAIDLGSVEAVYGFSNNDYAGFAPATTNRFKEIIGLPTTPLQRPQQGRLFE